MAEALNIEPYHFFIKRTIQQSNVAVISPYPRLSVSMKTEINNQIDTSIKDVIKEILDRY